MGRGHGIGFRVSPNPNPKAKEIFPAGRIPPWLGLAPCGNIMFRVRVRVKG